MAKVIGVKFKPVGKIYYFDPGTLEIPNNCEVIVETARGIECGLVSLSAREVSEEDIIAPLKKVIRIATAEDKIQIEKNREKEKEARQICLEKIEKHKMEMHLVDVECTFDSNKILFYFTADGRLDFRELVKDLASVFRTRIELRQIGVRDEAKKIGGLGICGRPLCCATCLDEFEPVSIKMAKEQGLSLNPTKISGSCSRLMCCLKFEQAAYEDLLKIMPKPGAIVKTPLGQGIVSSTTLLRRRVQVKLDKDDENIIQDFSVEEIKILKNPRVRNDENINMAELKKLEE